VWGGEGTAGVCHRHGGADCGTTWLDTFLGKRTGRRILIAATVLLVGFVGVSTTRNGSANGRQKEIHRLSSILTERGSDRHGRAFAWRNFGRFRGGCDVDMKDTEKEQKMKKYKQKLEEFSDLSLADMKLEMDRKGIIYRDLCEKYMFRERLAEFECGLLDPKFIGKPRAGRSTSSGGGGGSRIEEVDDYNSGSGYGSSGNYGGYDKVDDGDHEEMAGAELE